MKERGKAVEGAEVIEREKSFDEPVWRDPKFQILLCKIRPTRKEVY